MAPENLLSTIRSEIEKRLDALRPLLAEHEQLLGALSALEANAVAPPGETKASARGGAARRRSKADTPKRSTTSRSSGMGSMARSRTRAPRGARTRAPRGAAREAILGALEHGSHTVSELVVVTAMTGPTINGNLRRLLSEGAITKTDREGKTAYALNE